MSDDDLLNSIATGDTIDDFLVSLASGVTAAQKKMQEIGYASGSTVTYQIPQLEFELKLQISTTKQPSTSSKSTLLARQIMRVAAPVGKEEATAASTLKGMLVAVPVNAGKPRYAMDVIFAESEDDGVLEVIVTLRDATGAPQQGVDVELNVDRDASYVLNKEQGIDKRLNEQTHLLAGVIRTDEKGIAQGVLEVHSSETKGMLIVISADALGESRTLNYRIS